MLDLGTLQLCIPSSFLFFMYTKIEISSSQEMA